jgi:hypothetical protein
MQAAFLAETVRVQKRAEKVVKIICRPFLLNFAAFI